MKFLTPRGRLPIRKDDPFLVAPRAIPILLLLACLLFASFGCSLKQQDSYADTYPVSRPSSHSSSSYASNTNNRPEAVQVATAPYAASSPAYIAVHNNVVEAARSTIGAPYRFGGSSPATGFDCSGLVSWSFEQTGVRVPRRAQDQLSAGQTVLRRSELKPGDIVVFKGTNNRTGWHSGIYTGSGRFVHSPRTGKNVIESSLDEEYYAKRFAGGSRVLSGDSLLTASYNTQAKRSARKETTLSHGGGDDLVAFRTERSAAPKASATKASATKAAATVQQPKAKKNTAPTTVASAKSGAEKNKKNAPEKDKKTKATVAANSKKAKNTTVAAAKPKKDAQAKPATSGKDKKSKQPAVTAKNKKAGQPAATASTKNSPAKAVATKNATPSRTVASAKQKAPAAAKQDKKKSAGQKTSAVTGKKQKSAARS